jgi:hypothetical protein
MAKQKIIIPLSQAVRPIWETMPTTPKYSHLVGHETIQYEVEVDFDGLHSLACEAANNKKQVAVRGPFTVRVLQKATHPVKEQHG